MAARLGRSRPASNYRPIHPVKTNIALATLSMTLGSVTISLDGATVPTGDVSMTLSPVTVSFDATATGGSFAMTLQSVTADYVGAVNPIGDFALTLQPITMVFTTETVPFGAHVIHVEPERRALRVIDADPGLIPIYKSEIGG